MIIVKASMIWLNDGKICMWSKEIYRIEYLQRVIICMIVKIYTRMRIFSESDVNINLYSYFIKEFLEMTSSIEIKSIGMFSNFNCL